MTGSHLSITTTLVANCLLFLLEGSSALQLSSGWALLSSTADDDNNSTRELSDNPGPRSGSATWMDTRGQAWLFGGRTPDPTAPAHNTTQLLADLWMYDVASGIWKRIVSGNSSSSIQHHPAGREHASICGTAISPSLKNKNRDDVQPSIFIFGGRIASSQSQPISEQYRASDELLVLRHGQSEWQVVGAASANGTPWPPARYDALSWCDESTGVLSIVGGRSEPEMPLVDAWTLDLLTMTWRSVEPPVTACAWTAAPAVHPSATPMLTAMTTAAPPEKNASVILVSPKEGASCPTSGCAPRATTTPPPPPPLQLALVWQVAIDNSLYIMCDNETVPTTPGANHSTTLPPPIDDPNIQLWYSGPEDESVGEGTSPTAVPRPRWRLAAESGRGAQTWPGTHRHGGTCADRSGNLWLFAGQSQLGGHRYLNNDVWSYDVAANAWLKVELPAESSAEPEQRHLAAVWCLGDAMLVYGGLTCDEDDVTVDSLADCLRGDLWMLNLSVPVTARRHHLVSPPSEMKEAARRPPLQRQLPVSADQLLPTLTTLLSIPPPKSTPPSTSIPATEKPSYPSQKSDWLLGNRIPTDAPHRFKNATSTQKTRQTTARPSPPNTIVVETPAPKKTAPEVGATDAGVGRGSTTSASHSSPVVLQSSKTFNGTAGASLTLDAGSVLHSEIPGPHSVFNHPTRQEMQEANDHGAYGSAIFFGISLSMFAIFGVVLFFRRCVSCPPRENSLLKEAPPVRYTVIPDDNYSI